MEVRGGGAKVRGGVVWSQGEGVEWCGAKVRGWSVVEPR